MGVVYKAHDTRLDRTVALKFLPPHLSADEDAKVRFVHEAKAASALDHENICTIHDIGETETGQLFIAMAYYAGETLKAKIARGPLPDGEAVDLAVQLAEGLARAHKAGIVHRDIKPANVMITDRDRVKIVDFGLAKMADLQLTKTGTTMGTVAYMSPEQARGEVVDHRTDLWSLGVVLYEMLTGERPFKGAYADVILYALLHEEPVPITQVNASVPPDLASIVMRCLEKDRDLRYPAMSDLLADLEERTREQAAPRPSPVRSVLIAGAGVLVTLLVLLAFAPVRQAVLDTLGLGGLPAQKHLVVLPFTLVDENATPSEQAFSDGLTEMLTSKLVQLEAFEEAFWVAPADATRERGVTEAGQARRVLGVNLAVTGRLERDADRVRLTLELIDTETLRLLKTSVVEGLLDEEVTFQEDVLLESAALLGVEVPPPVRRMLSAGRTTAPGAYEYYLQGRGYLQRYDQPDQIDFAIGLFEKALHADSAYALAFAGLGEAYLRKYDATLDPQWAEAAEMYCERAIEAHDQLAPVYVTLGHVHRKTGKYGSAKAFFELALTRDSTNTEALLGLGSTYRALGDVDQAEETFQHVIALKPEYWGGYHNLGAFYLRFARYEEALAQFQWVIALTPDNVRGYRNVGNMQYFLGHFEEALQAWQHSLEIEPSYRVYSNLATLYYFKFQNYTEAARTYEQALALNDNDYLVWGNLATAYYWADGERDKAAAAWRRQIEQAETLLAVNPRNQYVLARLAKAHAHLGESEQALAFIERVRAENPVLPDPIFLIGIVYEVLGERDLALAWIGNALNSGLSLEHTEADPWLRTLRTDPQYQRLLPQQDIAQ